MKGAGRLRCVGRGERRFLSQVLSWLPTAGACSRILHVGWGWEVRVPRRGPGSGRGSVRRRVFATVSRFVAVPRLLAFLARGQEIARWRLWGL